MRKSQSPRLHERLYNEYALMQAQRDQIFKPELREELEVKENCTFRPSINFQTQLSSRHFSIGSDCLDAPMRRKPEQFVRDMMMYEQKRKVKID
jgi:hypothetical protein